MEYKHSLCDQALMLGILFFACENCQNVALGVKTSKEISDETI